MMKIVSMLKLPCRKNKRGLINIRTLPAYAAANPSTPLAGDP
jgi:hypothetical protein